jgi:Leucine-rich repeat (LRR) protein
MRRLHSSNSCVLFLHSWLTLLLAFVCPANAIRGDYAAWRELNNMSETPSFVPLPDADAIPTKMKFYEDPPGQWNVRYHDAVGLVDLPVPKHFRLLSRDRIVYELQWQHQKGGGTEWTERVVLEWLYYNIMKPPIRDDTLFETNVYKHPKAALKQQQRHQYTVGATRRTFQDFKRENALAAATAHRIGGLTGILYHSGTGVPGRLSTRKMDTAYGWLREEVDICEWEGVVCGDFSATSQYYWNTAGITTALDTHNKYIQQEKWTCDHCPDEADVKLHVTKLELPYAGLVGVLPNEIYMLNYLDLTRNDLSGTLVGQHKETTATLAGNHDQDQPQRTPTLSTSPPPSFPECIREIWLGSNQLNGTIPLDFATPLLLHLDLSKNRFTGSLPRYGRKQLPKIKSLLFEDNFLTGKLPPKWAGLTNLEVIDVGGNILNGTIPSIYGTMSNLRDFNIATNTVSGGIPTEFMQLSNLESLMLSQNRLRGTLPGGDDTVPHRAMREPEAGYKWSQLTRLQFFHASDNFLTSTLPPDFFYGLSNTIQRFVGPRSVFNRLLYSIVVIAHINVPRDSIDFSYNELTGTIPREIAKCSHLERVNLQSNWIRGTLPSEMSRMNPNLELNFTNNL